MRLVCPACRTVVFRQVPAGPAPGKRSTALPVPEDMTPLRIGATGRYAGRPFAVTGRLRYTFQGGYQNWWALDSGDGSPAWLVEAYGDYAVVQPSGLKTTLQAMVNTKAGKTHKFGDGVPYRTVTRDKNTGIRFEGELPGPGDETTGFASVELAGETGDLLIVQVHAGTRIAAYAGRRVAFADLQPDQLRDLHEWT
jgi:hypothetical protein